MSWNQWQQRESGSSSGGSDDGGSSGSGESSSAYSQESAHALALGQVIAEHTFDEPDAGDYFVENERSYNTASYAYRFPGDQEEVIRQDRQHYLLSLSLPGLHRGPIDDYLCPTTWQRRILDLGCGTGIWLAEMAARYPHCDCVGIDIMPLQHDHQAANTTYMCLEMPEDLHRMPPSSFDVIHIRQMLYSLEDYESLIQEAYRMLREPGLLLVHELSFELHSAWDDWSPQELAPALVQWFTYLGEALTERGMDLDTYSRVSELLSDTGFEEVETYAHYRQPCHEDYQTDEGTNEVAHLEEFLAAARLVILESGVDSDELDELEEEIGREIRGQSQGSAGVMGATGILSEWTYWCAYK